MSRVIVIEEWPSISWTILGRTPLVNSSVAQVCRRLWKRVAIGNPARVRSFFEGTVNQHPGVHRLPGLVGKDQVVVIPQLGQRGLLCVLGNLVVPQGFYNLGGEGYVFAEGGSE